ncbi:sigma-70 family RNA polymerase sigma factor [Indioceanicola profundi]|uniref:sigma-70 family RNA polymerase sigma factor n=1 Tax=Indioceanicola profundi TaxID=2220096 RepID=UPI0013C45EE2|nr:sigma-70 family RNA polymerase sigma factor [Indioceanicola profundi]
MDVGALYAAHGPWLRGWLRRHTRCSDRASDLAHDTFCRVLERQPPDTPAEPRAFLATVARRLLVDDIRRREIERAYLDVCAAWSAEGDCLTPERIAEAVDLLTGVLRLLADLPAMTRRAFLLRRLDGLSHAEVATELGISERTVKRHIAAAYAHCYALAYPD